MSNKIRIKRRAPGGAAGSPGSLENAELAFNEADDTLYYGKGTGGEGGTATTVEVVGGLGAFLSLTGTQTVTGNKTFSGTIVLPSTTSIGSVTSTEIGYIDGVTSAIQTQINSKSPINDPTFTGTVTLPSGTVTSGMILDGTIVDADINASAAIAATKISGTALVASTVTAKGDILAATASATVTRLGIGTDGYFLKADSAEATGLKWVAVATSFIVAGNSGSDQTITSGSDTLTIVGGTALTSVAGSTDTITLNLDNTAVSAGSYGGAGTVGTFTVDAQGRLTAAGNTSISITSAAITDFTEAAQDAVESALTAGTGVSKNYDDAANTITLSIGQAVGTSSNVTFGTVTAALTGNVTGTVSSLSNQTTANLTELTNLYYTDARVRANRLDQLAAPDADVSLNSYKITGLGNPTGDQDAANKAYVDAARAGLDVKASVRVASTVNIAIATALINDSTIDDVVVATGDRVLLKNQSTLAQNGIYVVVASGAASRSTDADISAEVTTGMFTFVSEGTVNADSGWVLTTNDAITLGTTELVFTQNSGVGQITAGAGLTKTGNTLDVGGTADRITIGGDTVDIASTYVGQATITTLGTITTGTWTGTTIALNKGGTGATTDSGARTALGLVIGTDVQAYDGELAALAGLTSASDKLPYFTGSGTASLATLTSFGRSLIDDVDDTAARLTLALGTMAIQNASNVAITGGTLDGITFDGGTF